MDEPGQITVDTDATRPGWSRLLLSGRVTVSSATELHAAARAIAASGTNASVCCGGVEYIDVSGLQVLLCLGRELARAGRQCDVTDVPGAIGELFRLAGLGSAA